MIRTVAIALAIACGIARAEPPSLTSYDAKAFTVSVPTGWTVASDATKGMVVAQQDPKRTDVAQLVVMVSYSAVAVSETYVVDSKGGMTFKATGTHASTVGQGTFQSNEAGGGTFTIDGNRTITIETKGRATKYYVVRGWFVGAELTIMRANGPWWRLEDITPEIRDDSHGGNLDTFFVRKTR